VTLVIFSARAETDLDRLTDFLADIDLAAADKVAGLIIHAVRILERHPGIGRPARHGRRELVISHGKTGCVALYREDVRRDRVEILAIRHQREAGYGGSKTP
jgi:plasmid stabilization system protein ParE